MRILIHGINFAPEQIGIGKYTGEMASWLAGRGHSVRVVTAPPYYPAWSVEHNYRGWRYRRERLAGVEVWRCPLWVPARPTGSKRLLHLSSFALSSFPIMMRQVFWKPDVVLTIEPPLFCAPQGWLTARLSGAKTWLHVQDFEVEAFFGLGFTSSSRFKKLMVRMEAWIMRRFDHVSTISAAMKNRIVRLNIPENRTSLLPNWIDTVQVHPKHRGRDLRSEWGISPDQQIVLYSGNMGKKQGLEIILDIAAAFDKTHPDTIFLLVGEGPAKDSLVEGARQRRLDKVIFKPLQPVQDLPSLLGTADLHLVVQKRGVADAVMPSKLTGILAVGGNVIITADADTELGRLARDNPGIAVLAEPENREALTKAVANTLSRSAREGRVNSVARAYAERYLSAEVILNSFERELLEITGKG